MSTDDHNHIIQDNPSDKPQKQWSYIRCMCANNHVGHIFQQHQKKSPDNTVDKSWDNSLDCQNFIILQRFKKPLHRLPKTVFLHEKIYVLNKNLNMLFWKVNARDHHYHSSINNYYNILSREILSFVSTVIITLHASPRWSKDSCVYFIRFTSSSVLRRRTRIRLVCFLCNDSL